MTGSLGALPQALDRRQHLVLLRQKRIAQLLRPGEFIAHHLQCLGHRSERLDARVPWLLLHGILQGWAGETGILTRPTRCLDDLRGVG